MRLTDEEGYFIEVGLVLGALNKSRSVFSKLQFCLRELQVSDEKGSDSTEVVV